MSQIYATLKRRIFAVFSMRMVYNGYVIRSAMRWKRSVLSNFIKDFRTNIFYKLTSYKWGYLPAQRKILKINRKNKHKFLSYKKYLYLNGANGKYSKWLADIITTDKVLKDFRENLPILYYHLYMRENSLKIIALKDKLKETEEAVFNLIKEKKSVILTYSNYVNKFTIEYKDNSYYLDNEQISEKKLKSFIIEQAKMTRSLVIREDIKPTKDFKVDNENIKLFLKVYNKNGLEPQIGEVYCSVNNDYFIDNEFGLESIDEEYILESYSIKNYRYFDEKEVSEKINKSRIYFDETTGRFKLCVAQDKDKVVFFKKKFKEDKINEIVYENYQDIKNKIIEIFKTIPQIELAGVELTITDEGIKIINIINNPPYCEFIYFNKDFHEFLEYKYQQKRKLYKNFGFKFKIFRKKLYLKICKLFAILCYPKGLVPYQSFRWLKDVKDDFIENKNIPLSKKIWAYRHGFLSYRLAQYGITKENYKNFISDLEYKWLRHIDNYYKIWFEDKITIKYVASEYNNLFPKYYYYISQKQGGSSIIPMMDAPKKEKYSYEDIFKLVKKEKEIALKRDKGSHGEGFYRLSYKDNKLYLNLQEATEEEVIEILSDNTNEYLITEYIKQHEVLNKIYDGAVNTIRIIVFKKDGKTPTIGNAYMRFGSKKTGTVDNIGAGGIFVSLDEETGHFHDALIITDDRKIVPCEKHPDSNLPIEGYIPNWDKIIKDILEIAEHLEQIEYFGFDIAITEDGIKFPEINRYPDYMKIGRLKPHSIDYLLGKLESKKKIYGYHKRQPFKLFRFIDRRKK